MSIALAILSALFYGCGDFMGGYATKREPVISVVAISQAAGLVLALIFLPFLGVPWPGLRPILFGMVGGAAGALGLFALYRGLGKTVVAIVSPTSALLSALIPLGFGAVMGERPSVLALAGVLVCAPAIFFLSREVRGDKEGARLSALLHGLVAGVGFGVFFIFLSQAGKDSGLWPLVGARFSSISLILLAALVTRQGIRLRKGDPRGVLLVVVAGIFDMGANIAFLVSSRMGLLMLVAAITALYPAPTVVLARAFLKQRLGWARTLGLCLAVAGAALIGMG
jgi:drug/metabolite transporter (DMT)-like permease